MAKKLKRPGRKISARSATIVRPIAARKHAVETMRSCRSTRNETLKSRSLLGNQAFACALARKSLKLSSIMNTKRLILAIVVAFVVLWVTDFLIHGVWMVPDYRGTQQLWRTDAAMGSRMKLDGSLFRNLGNHHVCRRS